MSLVNPNEADLSHLWSAAMLEKLVLFVGAGPSISAGLPDWNRLADKTLEELARNRDYKFSFADIEIIKALGPRQKLSIAHSRDTEEDRKEFYTAFRNCLVCAPSNTIINDILAEFSAPIVTTNYDIQIPRKNRIDQIDGVYTTLQSPQPHQVIHIHGSINHLDEKNAVITTKQYLKRYGTEDFRKGLRKLFTNHTVIFIGYSLHETELLEHIVRTGVDEPSQQKNIYALFDTFGTKDGQKRDFLATYWKDLGITALFYDRTEKNFDALSDALTDLRQRLFPSDIFTKANEFKKYLTDPNNTFNQTCATALSTDRNLAHAVFSSISRFEWIQELKDTGLFNTDHLIAQQSVKNQNAIAAWPALIYLSHATKSIQQLDTKNASLLLQVILETTSSLRKHNIHEPYIWYTFADLMPKIPTDLITSDFLEQNVRYWLSCPENLEQILIPICDKWMPQLLGNKDADSIRVSQAMLKLILEFGIPLEKYS